jgi:hypothetical protein
MRYGAADYAARMYRKSRKIKMSDDDDYRRAWMIVIDLFQDFQDGWFPSVEIGVLLRGSAPQIVKKNSASPRNLRRITLH